MHLKTQNCNFLENVTNFYYSVTYIHHLPQKNWTDGTKSSVSWDIMLYSLLKVNQLFGGKFWLHLQGKRISQARKQEGKATQVSSGGATRSCFSESRTLHNRSCVNLKSCILVGSNLQKNNSMGTRGSNTNWQFSQNRLYWSDKFHCPTEQVKL
jgi:hypothetical protein